jgi:hypothetical protein
MAEKKEEVKSAEQFLLSDEVRRAGYKATIGDREFHIGFELDAQGNRKDRFASEGKLDGDGTFKGNGLNYLTDLSPEQIRVLSLAGVIKLTEAQGAKYQGAIHGQIPKK